jgi:hypothetical protein
MTLPTEDEDGNYEEPVDEDDEADGDYDEEHREAILRGYY